MADKWESIVRDARQANNRGQATITAQVSEIIAMADEIDRLQKIEDEPTDGRNDGH